MERDLEIPQGFNPRLLDMDPRFHAAQHAMAMCDVDRLNRLLDADPALAKARSTRSHPTLLQCLVLQTPVAENLESMIDALARRGVDLNAPLTAAAGMNNLRAIAKLLDNGASVEGEGSWSPLEEAIYWGHEPTITLLIERGARINNLRKAAVLGDLETVASYFDATGGLKDVAGEVAWPFGDGLPAEHRKRPSEILNNALVHAAAWGRSEIARFLLDKGAAINAIPLGFDFAGTALHYAALRGQGETLERLLEWGADPAIPDAKIGKLPEDWAEHDGHPELAERLRAVRRAAQGL